MAKLLLANLVFLVSVFIISYSLANNIYSDSKKQYSKTKNKVINKNKKTNKKTNRCYKCSGVNYVCYKAKDTFLKRQKAAKLCKTRINPRSFYCTSKQCDKWIK